MVCASPTAFGRPGFRFWSRGRRRRYFSVIPLIAPEADKRWELDSGLQDGEIVEPWTTQPEYCPEESETPDPLSFNEEILHFMEMSVDEAREEYMGLIDSHMTEEMK